MTAETPSDLAQILRKSLVELTSLPFGEGDAVQSKQIRCTRIPASVHTTDKIQIWSIDVVLSDINDEILTNVHRQHAAKDEFRVTPEF